MKKNIAIIFGGSSSEYVVSLKSATAVIKNIDETRYNKILIGISREGKWYRYTGEIEEIQNNNWYKHDCVPVAILPIKGFHKIVQFEEHSFSTIEVDVIFPVLHGKEGEDGSIQGLLELAGIPYVGCDITTSAICMDKEIAHAIVKANGILVTKSVVIRKQDNLQEKIKEIEELAYPMYVKPSMGGSSIGIQRVENKEELYCGIDTAFRYDNKIIVEKEVEGFETECAILGNEDPIIGEIDEIALSTEFFSYEEKCNQVQTKIYLPARVSKELSDEIKKTALTIYHLLGCRDLARVDLFVTKENKIYFNEVNTMPGLTSSSAYPELISYVGIPFKEMIQRLIQFAESRGEKIWQEKE